jgi:hypothetical protein
MLTRRQLIILLNMAQEHIGDLEDATRYNYVQGSTEWKEARRARATIQQIETEGGLKITELLRGAHDLAREIESEGKEWIQLRT